MKAPTQRCPHCGGEKAAANYARHVAACPRNPALYALIVAALADPDQPGRAVNSQAYRLRVTGSGAPASKVLYDVFGSWEAACDYFGLRAPGSRLRAPGSRLGDPNEGARREALELAAARRDAEITAANILADQRSAECLIALDCHFRDGRRVTGPRPVAGGYAWTLR